MVNNFFFQIIYYNTKSTQPDLEKNKCIKVVIKCFGYKEKCLSDHPKEKYNKLKGTKKSDYTQSSPQEELSKYAGCCCAC